jgi:hypothetical protein
LSRNIWWSVDAVKPSTTSIECAATRERCQDAVLEAQLSIKYTYPHSMAQSRADRKDATRPRTMGVCFIDSSPISSSIDFSISLDKVE